MYRIKYENVLNEKGETVSVATGGEYFSFAAESEIKGLRNWRAKFRSSRRVGSYRGKRVCKLREFQKNLYPVEREGNRQRRFRGV